MSLSSEDKMNLAVLQRVDPYIAGIMYTASQVALYKYKLETGEWEKSDIEGSMFVYKRVAPPCHGFIIMNRQNPTNLIEPVVPGLEFQKSQPFLLYTNSKRNIFGLWFYEKADCDKLSDIMESLLNEPHSGGEQAPLPGSLLKAEVSKDIPSNNVRSIESFVPSVDIMSMLNKAQTEFNQERTESTGVPEQSFRLITTPRDNNVIKPRPVRAVSVSGTSDSTPAPVMRQLSVAELFANAGKLKQGAKPTDSATLHEPGLCSSSSLTEEGPIKPVSSQRRASTSKSLPFVQRLLLLDNRQGHIETSGNKQGNVSNNGAGDVRSILQNSVGRQENELAKTADDEDTPMLLPSMVLAIPANITPPPSPSVFQFGTLSSTSNKKEAENSQVGNPPLMVPSMFAYSSDESSHEPDERLNTIRSTSSRSANNTCQVEPLTRTQLQQSLLYLVQNDSQFVGRIHEGYIQSLHNLTFKNT